MPDMNDPEAPHGRDENGVPLAPYGYRADGRPKLSNRGRKPKVLSSKKTAARTTGRTARKRTDAETRDQLVELAGIVTTGIAALSGVPWVEKRLGPKHTAALAGDAVILESAAPAVADVMIQMAQRRPGLLAWMDAVEDKAPMLALLQVGAQVTKSIVANHMHPDPELAVVGRSLGRIKAARFAAALREEADRLGVELDFGDAEPASDAPARVSEAVPA